MDGEAWEPSAAGVVQPVLVPAGFTPATLEAVIHAARAARAAGRDPAAVARDVAWGQHPALPASLISDAVQHVLARI